MSVLALLTVVAGVALIFKATEDGRNVDGSGIIAGVIFIVIGTFWAGVVFIGTLTV